MTDLASPAPALPLVADAASLPHDALSRAKGPVALLIAEDAVALAETVSHHLDRGFATVAVALPHGLDMSATDPRVTLLRAETRASGAAVAIVNTVVEALPPGTWLYWGFNAEFLVHPHFETRRVGEMLAFHDTERRFSMPTMVVDLFPRDHRRHPNGVDLDAPAYDGTGYYGEPRYDAEGRSLDRQVSIRGGLRWRMASLVPEGEERLDRIALVRTASGLRLLPDLTWSDPELNTLSCPWHRNMTAAIASFRAAKALAINPGPAAHLAGFDWPGAVTWDWSSRQFLEAGFMEVGQWF